MCQHLEDAGESSAWLLPTGDFGDEAWKSVGCMCGEAGLSLVDVVNWQKGTEADCSPCGPWVVFVSRFYGGLGWCNVMLATTL